jgi:hypothetical protein
MTAGKAHRIGVCALERSSHAVVERAQGGVVAVRPAEPSQTANPVEQPEGTTGASHRNKKRSSVRISRTKPFLQRLF